MANGCVNTGRKIVFGMGTKLLIQISKLYFNISIEFILW